MSGRISFLIALVSCFSTRLIVNVIILPGVSFALAHSCWAQIEYDPDHPVVQEMIDDALDFLESNQSGQLGNRVLMGMAAYKVNIRRSATPKEHPLIQAAVDAVTSFCREDALRNSPVFLKMYASSLACVLLLELDSVKYRSQINVLLDHIAERQQDSGAWGYRQYPTAGDTSQMQYIALALWLAHHHGFDVDPQSAKRALQWLVDSQQQNGGWFYQNPPGVMPSASGAGDREVRHSLVAAGLGSVYLFSDYLGLGQRNSGGALGMLSRGDEYDLPPSIRDITNEQDRQTTTTESEAALVSFDIAALRRTIKLGDQWFQDHFRPDPAKFGLYYLYGFERYASLRENVQGALAGIENWYDQGVRHLKTIQTSAGNFPGSSGDVSDIAKTSFGILFLTRSMQITISGSTQGIAIGQPPLQPGGILSEGPDGTIRSSLENSVANFLKLIEHSDSDTLETIDQYRLRLDDDTSRSQQLAMMRLLVRHNNFHVRLAAVRFLGDQRALDNVPALLFALTDPDPRIAAAANEALKFVSRKTSGFELSKQPTETEIDLLKQQWTDWYLHIQPGARLLDG